MTLDKAREKILYLITVKESLNAGREPGRNKIVL
jgi:hypothetical protein